MTEYEQQQLQNAFNKAQMEGMHWVAFNDRPKHKLTANWLPFFISASEAERFCDKANYEIDPFEEAFGLENYIYTPIESLKTALGFNATKPADEMDMVKIAQQMAGQELFVPKGQHFNEWEHGLQIGLVYPVLWGRTIDPLKEIADFHVVAYRHIDWESYENGQSCRVLGSFSRFMDARSFVDNAVLHNGLADKGTDYLIIGRFYDKRLELNLDGYALPSLGLTLMIARHDNNYGYKFQEVQSLTEQAKIRQYFFAGVKDNELCLYNDKLERTTMAESQRPFYPKHFNNNYLILKNSSIMNEQSFDYVKNQLFYLGFGEEIAAPLRVKMEQNLTEFTLPHTRKFGPDETHSVLYFSKGDQKDKDMTFFNRADVTLKQPGKEDLTQSFFYGKEYNYTLQERYNMMDGRAAYREQPKVAPVEENGSVRMKPTGETYFAWRGLDFKTADRYGNFNPKVMFWNHQKEVGKYPIKGIEEMNDKQRLITKLERGNKVDVILVRDGHEMPAKMVANPKMARLDFYDTNGQVLIVRKVEKQAVDQTQKVEMTPQEVQRAAIAKAAEEKQGQNQTPGQQPDKKETQKEEVAAEQQNNNSQRRKQGVHI